VVHLRRLIAARFLASYHITAAKSWEGFVITFRPGSAFFAGYYAARIASHLAIKPDCPSGNS